MSSKVRKATGAAIAVIAAIAGSNALAQANMVEGKKLFTQTATPACAVCHTLDHAEAQGAIGPNLDELKPNASRVEKAVRNGSGQMPAFKSLTDEQVKTLAKYVATATGAEK
jgi:mono/diheme cytochrome c family protein